MEFFPALIIIGVMWLCELICVFVLNSKLDYSTRILIGLLSAGFALILFVVLCQGMGWWAATYPIIGLMLSKALWYNHEGTRPISDKE